MYETILVPTDGSDHAVRAAEHGFYLARALDATPHLISVVDVQGAAGVFGAGGVDREFVERLESRGEAAIREAKGVHGGDGAVETALPRGDPSGAILEYADEHGADLIAMGTAGRTGIDRYVAGSVTERVVRRAEVPVLTVRAVDRSRLGGDYDEILLATDGSDPATAAADHALGIAKRTGARIHAVSVVDVRGVLGSPDTVPAAVTEHVDSRGMAATEAVASRARDRGVDVRTEVREGVPTTEILGYADEHGIDLTVMGTAGRTGLDRYLIGSTTARVIRRAETPVLAVRAPGSSG